MNRILYSSVLLFAIILISVNQRFVIVDLDDSIRQKVQDLWSPDLNKVIIAITDFGAEASVLLLTLFTLIYFGIKKQGKVIRFFISGLFGAILLFSILKDIIGRARPSSMMVQEEAMSFPSGHATIATVLAWFCFLVFSQSLSAGWKRVLLTACIVYPLLMSFTRVYLNVHYLSDVIAGIALGSGWMIFLAKFYLNREA